MNKNWTFLAKAFLRKLAEAFAQNVEFLFIAKGWRGFSFWQYMDEVHDDGDVVCLVSHKVVRLTSFIQEMQRQLVSKALESERIEVPLAIQTYLWGQTSFFLKLNLHEKKSYGHVCVAFEKIICENRVGDLPPNLSRSMNTIPRWHFVQGALPFVLHCCSALLSNRAVHGNAEERLSVAETKLLYTLHWILIKAPEEVENYSGKLYPLNVVELFIQSVVPYVNCIQPQDLTFRLQEGLELWEALWEFRSPNLKCFTATVVHEKQDGDKISLDNSTKNSCSTELQTTFFDLAVIKCLMLPDWHEEGRVWGLKYILKYLENEETILQEQSNRNSSISTTEVKTEPPVVEKVTKPVPQATIANVDKLKRFYGLNASPDAEGSGGQRRRSVKDNNRIRHISSSSSSSLIDALATLSNLKLPVELEDNRTEVVNGAKELLDEYGTLKKTVFLDVICQIASQSSNARVCDLVLSVLEHILEKHIVNVRVPEKDTADSAPSDKEQQESGTPVSKQSSEGVVGKFSFLLSFRKALVCVIKIVRALGCSYGCGKGIRGVIGKNLRAKTMAMLTKMHEIDQDNFKSILQNFIEDEDVEVVTNFLHALLGFCTMTLESKSNQKKMSDHFKEKTGIVGVIIDIVFAPYVARLLEFNLEEISNVTLFGHVRQLAKYVKEYAGGTFFRVVFRGLLKASGKPKKRLLDPLPQVKPALSANVTDGVTMGLPKVPTTMEKILTPKNQRKHFFSKFSKSTSSGDGSPVGNSEFGFDGSTTPLSRRKAMKAMKKGSPIEEPFSVEDDMSPVGSTERRRRSLMKKFFKSNRKKADEIFGIELRKTGGVSLTSFRQHSGGVEYTSIPVNVQEVRDGMMMFSMLLESCLPGSVPDPNIVAGILELKAPAVSRGALLVECAHFVHRCNKGEWPSWLLSSHPSTRRGKGGFGALVRNAIAVSRRNVRIKHEAGLLFYKWAVAIGERLEQIETRSTESNKTESNKESKDVTDQTRQIEEDFLDEGTLNEETRKCPHALKMVACQLLLEITAFLRESHSSLAKKAENQRMRNKSIAFSRQNRRTTQKVSVHGGEHRDAVTSGPAERLRQGNPSMLSPVMSLLVPTVQIQQGSSDKKVSAPVIKVDGGPSTNEGEEAAKPARKRFSALFSYSEKKRKLLKPENTERKVSSSTSRISKKSSKGHKAVGRVTSDASDTSDNEEEEVTKFPWLKAVTMVCGSTNFICDHRDVCAPGCIRRQTQSCAKFMSALKTIYSKPVSQLTNNSSKKLEGEKGRQCKLSTKELTIKQKEERDKVMITYVSEKVRNLFNCPMSVMMKGAVVMEPSLLLNIIPLAWELLLNPLEELVSTAAAVFLIASLHLKDVVEKMLHKELTCNSCEHQVKSLMRYGVLWRSRYHVWPRMEVGAKYVLRIPLPKLDFTLPSPPVGSSAPLVPDCPWDPTTSIHITKNELELTEEDKQKDEEEASKLKEEKKKERTFYNFTNTSISLEASTPAEPEEGSDLISQPITTDFWPPAMSTAIPRIIGLLDDSSVTSSQTAVSEVAKNTIWECLVDDPMLFFRTFFEDITKSTKQKELVFLLNKLIVHFPLLPPNAGVILFNHLMGVVLFYSRRSQPCSEEAIALILSSLLWKVVPSVPKLYLKDLKYSAKKEHCERTLMVTANTPGTKKIVVTCPKPDKKTESEKLTVREDMTFDHILQYCTAKWSLENPHYRLLDAKSGHILEGKHLVRDIYAFKKGFPYPQLKLQVYKELDAYVKRQDQAFVFKMAEVGRLYLTLGILETVQNWHHVSFLHSELSKQIAFPRKALDVDFGLYEGGLKGRQLFAIDGIHKRMWIKLLSKLFDSMTSSFPWGDNDLHLFLNVINGALLLQCEDSSMLRFCLSTFINAAIKFTDIFAIDGYHHILPTLALLYSHHESNEIVCSAVEFVISQFYILHQKPFLLQLFASIEPILLTENVNKMPEHSDETDESNMILPKCLFAILSSLEKDVPDSLDILALVEANKPLKPLDSCYEGKLDENECKIDIAIRLCVTVVAFSPESIRATQMLVVLSSILPFYLEYVKNNDGTGEKKKESRDELTTLQSFHCSVQVLLKSCNSLRRPFLKMKGMSSAARKRVREGSTGSCTSFTTSHENIRQSRAYHDDDDRDVDSLDQQFKPFLSKFSTQDEGEQVLDSLYEFRTPRNAILVIASEFISTSKKRLKELNEKNMIQIPNLALDHESILALCNIAHTLLKLSLTDTVSLELTGLQKFMLEALPNIDWSAEVTLPALNLVLKRINTTFTKITDKPDLMNFFWPYPLLLHRSENWNVTEVLLKGLYLAISKQFIVTTLPYTKAVVATCMRLVLREQVSESDADSSFNYYPPPSLSFSQLVVKLAARLMYSLKDKYSLKDLCGGTIEFGNADRTLRVLVHILLPLCIRLGSGSKDQSRASKEDVSYAVSCFLNIIVTPVVGVSISARRLSCSIMPSDTICPSSPFVQRVLPRRSDAGGFSPSIYNAAYLGLKVMIICFPHFLSSEWRTMASVLKEVVMHGAGNEPLFEFLEFIILHRSPLFLLLLPIIRTKIHHLKPTDPRAGTVKEDLLKRLQNPTDPTPSKEEWMQRFVQDLGVLTGGEQNDMFFFRNPGVTNAHTDHNSVMDVESLSDPESIHPAPEKTAVVYDSHVGNEQGLDYHARQSLEVPERARKLSSSRKESTDKSVRKSLKKKVSFDKGKSYNLFEDTKDEDNSERPSASRQKRSLPRQEFAVDLESPISNKRLSEKYPVSTTEDQSSVDGQNDENHEKKRKIGKSRKFKHENAAVDSSQSTEVSSFSGISQESADQTADNACPTGERSDGIIGMTLTIPNLVVKATITENSNSAAFDARNIIPLESCSSQSNMETPLEMSMVELGERNSTVPDNVALVGNIESPNTLCQDYPSSNDRDPSSNGSQELLLPTDDSDKEVDSSRKSLAVPGENTRWSCSELDISKETSL